MENLWDKSHNIDYIYFSDDDDYEDAYNQAMEYPLLSRIVNCNKSPEKIITITQPRTNVRDEPIYRAKIEGTVSSESFDKLTDLVNKLSLEISMQRNELKWFIVNKQEMQKQIDFLHDILDNEKRTKKNGLFINTTPKVEIVTQDTVEPERKTVATQTQWTYEATPVELGSHAPLHLTISLHGASCARGTH
jgi:hypothetical protein